MSQVRPYQVFRDHSAACPQILTVWKNALIFSGTGFTIFDSSGNVLFRVENSIPNVKSEVLLMNPAGIPLFLLRRKAVSLHQRWEGFICNEADGHGSPKARVFSIKRSCIISPTTSIDVFVGSSPIDYLRSQCDYRIKGSFRQRLCSIYNRSGSIVAQVKRKRGSCDMLLEKDVFTLVVYPGFDPALIMSWIVVVDHINGEDLSLLSLHRAFKSYQLVGKIDTKGKDEFSNDGDCST